ncbi:uncharacterized protein [Amphiura filiformis]|uniref:uncharacterized protein n=1 Tax=Amphiura filiformis TaxID=82378 RepID=UPI003B2240D1
MATGLSKEEYLKRYLSGGGDDTKKKKKKKKQQGAVKSSRNMVIHDDDIDVKKLIPDFKDGDRHAVDKLNVDEAPLVADVIDERPVEEIQLEQFRTSNKWKLLHKDKDDDKGSSAASSRGRHDSDSDLSPARNRQSRHDSDSDQSPPQRNQTNSKPKKSRVSPKLNKSRHDSDSDMSPPRGRKSRHDSDSDMSPPRSRGNGGKSPTRRTRHDSDSDVSPPRRTKINTNSSKRTRHDSDSDVSPPRRNQHQGSDSDVSPPRRNQRHGNQRHGSDSDVSPPRRKASKSKTDSDLNPPRKSKQRRRDSDSDLSPPRKTGRRGSDSDLSPPRRSRGSKGSDGGRERKVERSRGRQDSDGDLSPPRRDKSGKSRLDKMASGAKAGLQDARTMRNENNATRKRNTEMFSHMTDEMSGKNAETVFRDRSSGRRRDLKMEKIKQREEQQKKAEEDEKFMEWGKGLVQKKQMETTAKDHIHEMAKPMARYRDDEDLDAMLKEKDREGDPMLAFMKKKQAKQNAKLGIKEKPKYKGPTPPPNRFNIMPGYRWDGVDRSNGFEKKFFIRNANKKAMDEVAYKWSIEDM